MITNNLLTARKVLTPLANFGNKFQFVRQNQSIVTLIQVKKQHLDNFFSSRSSRKKMGGGGRDIGKYRILTHYKNDKS